MFPKISPTLKHPFLTILTLYCLLQMSQICGSTGSTYYVYNDGTTSNGGEGSGWNTVDDCNACTSKSPPCLTLKGGVAIMSAEDTLITGDGIYPGSNDVNTFL